MEVLLPFIVAFIITILFTPPTIFLAKKFNLVDDPNKRPHPAHIQQRIIPRAGGLPIFFGLLIPILIFVPFDKHILGIITGIIVLLLMGLLDDYLVNFNPYSRLILQFIAAALVVISGVGISYITNPLGGILRLDQITYSIELFGTHNIILIADIFAFIWIVFLMNMINWSKGVDGQMPGITTIAGIILGILSYKLYKQGDPNQLPIAILSFITAGTSLGFLIFNWYPAKILPAFSGSTILGFVIATLSILSGAKLATALLVLLIPSIDFFYTFFRRLFAKKSPFYGDQKHLHHLLLNRGWTHRQISLFYIISCAILGLLAISLSSQGKLFASLSIGILCLGAILWLHTFLQKGND